MGRRSNVGFDNDRQSPTHDPFNFPSAVLSIATSDLAALQSRFASSQPVSLPTVASGSTRLSTLTFETTIVTTSFLTVRPSTNSIHLTVTSSSTRESATTSHSQASSCQSSRASSIAQSTASSNRHYSTSSSTSVPASSSSTSFASTNPPGPSSSSVPSSVPSASSSASQIKHRAAIIGGLSGAIAGLVLVGILLCCIFRRCRKSSQSPSIGSPDNAFSTWPVEDDDNYLIHSSPSIFHPPFKAVPAPFAQKRLPPPPRLRPDGPLQRAESTASESSNANPNILDGDLIRVSLDHWPRPFVLNESFRDSSASGRLHVTNPDILGPASRSGSPTPAPRPPAPAMAAVQRDWAPALFQPPPRRLSAARQGKRAPLRPDTFAPPDQDQDQPSPTLPAPLQIRRGPSRPLPPLPPPPLPPPPPPPPLMQIYRPGTALTASVPVFHGLELDDPFLTPPTPDGTSFSSSTSALSDADGQSGFSETEQPQQRRQQQKQQQPLPPAPAPPPPQQQQQKQQSPPWDQNHFLRPPVHPAGLGPVSCNSSRSNLSSRGSSAASDPFDLDFGASTERLGGEGRQGAELRRWREGVGLYEGT